VIGEFRQFPWRMCLNCGALSIADRAMGRSIGLWLGGRADGLRPTVGDRRLGTSEFTAVRLDWERWPIDGAVLGNNRAGADGKSVVWREGGVCQTLAGRRADRAWAGKEDRLIPLFWVALTIGDESVR
jgi:hypothetical protein